MRVLTSYELPEIQWWSQRTDHIDITQGARSFLKEVYRRSADYDAFMVRGSTGFSNRYVGQLSAALAARTGLPTVLAECIWESTSRRFGRKHTAVPAADLPPPGKGIITRKLISTLDHPLMYYCVLSEEERLPFARRWNVPAERVISTGYCATSLNEDASPEQQWEVFAGGDSLRDYRALIAVADQLSAPVRIATKLAAPCKTERLEIGWMSGSDYEKRSRAAAVVVVPLAAGLERSAGQQTYLNAMLAGKPVVVTDVLGVREHIADGETGFLVPANDQAKLRSTIELLLSDAGLRAAVGESARRRILEKYTRDQYFGRLLDITEAWGTR